MYQLDVLVQDLRYGLRLLRRSPQLACAIVLTLVLGVGLNSVVLSIFNGLLFRAQVSRDPASFVQIYAKLSGRWHREIHGNRYMVTLEDFDAIRARTETLSAVTASKWATFTLRDAEPVDIRGKFVSCNYMSAHMRPALVGRGFVEADCLAPGGQRVVVVTELGWNVRFGRDPAIIGRTLRLQTEFVTVIWRRTRRGGGRTDRATHLCALHDAAAA